MHSENSISIWFFIGVSLLVNGLLIFGAGLYTWMRPPDHPVVLFQLHADVWWGAVLAVVGVVYTIYFRPGKSQA
jgi:hypothetical protein